MPSFCKGRISEDTETCTIVTMTTEVQECHLWLATSQLLTLKLSLFVLDSVATSEPCVHAATRDDPLLIADLTTPPHALLKHETSDFSLQNTAKLPPHWTGSEHLDAAKAGRFPVYFCTTVGSSEAKRLFLWTLCESHSIRLDIEFLYTSVPLYDSRRVKWGYGAAFVES
jgi:hypothetical protein